MVSFKSIRMSIFFDDSVSDKNHSHKMELVRLQYSGNAHGLIKGIGIVNCLYVNPRTKRYWIIDWRVYAPDSDDKTKLVHMQEMFDDALNTKKLPFRVVLMDSWYATKDLMLHIHRAGKFFYCPLKSNRKVDDSGGVERYKAVNSLQWSAHDAGSMPFPVELDSRAQVVWGVIAPSKRSEEEEDEP